MPRAPFALTAALMLVAFADEWTTFLPAGALEPIRGDLHLTYGEAGFVLAALAAGGLVGNLFIVAADYVSRRALAAAGALAYGAAMIAFGGGHSLAALLSASFVWGAASDAFIHACDVALVDLAGESLPRVMARANGWAALGDLLGPLTIAAAAVLAVGWRDLFIGGGIAMLAYGAWLASQKFPPPHPRERLPHPVAGVLAVLADRRILVLAALLGLFGLLDEPLLGFTIAYMERVRGLAPALATGLAMAIIAGGLTGFALFERIARGRSALALPAAATAVMAAALPAMVFSPVLALQFAAAAVFGCAGAVFYTRLQTLALALLPGQAGSTSAVVGAIGMLGLPMPALVGWVSDRHGLAAGLGLYAAVPIAMLILIIAAPKRGFGEA